MVKPLWIPVRPKSLQTFLLTVAAGVSAGLAGCSATENGNPNENGGDTGLGGSASTGGGAGAGGTTAMGGAPPSGGTTSVGGNVSTGGAASSGGTIATGGAGLGGGATGGTAGIGSAPTGGTTNGGAASGGTAGTGGAAMGGSASGGKGGGGAGGSASGGKAGSGGSGTGGSVSCTGTPLTGGTPHTSSNASGTAAGLAWTIWTNSSAGTITTYDRPAFKAAWNNSGDFLARLGLQWNATKTYDQYGTITAQFDSTKTGTGGGYSYIGIYGWSVSPCVEFYIVDDSYNRMPVNPGNTTNKGTASIDGGTYTLYTRNTTGTGGSKCPGVSSWTQFYSVRQAARTCGQISITAHFDAWKAAGMALGRMDQAQILIEVGGGTGSIDFTVASVTATMP
jgi:endo-1,4-beta-xylanase